MVMSKLSRIVGGIIKKHYRGDGATLANSDKNFQLLGPAVYYQEGEMPAPENILFFNAVNFGAPNKVNEDVQSWVYSQLLHYYIVFSGGVDSLFKIEEDHLQYRPPEIYMFLASEEWGKLSVANQELTIEMLEKYRGKIPGIQSSAEETLKNWRKMAEEAYRRIGYKVEEIGMSGEEWEKVKEEVKSYAKQVVRKLIPGYSSLPEVKKEEVIRYAGMELVEILRKAVEKNKQGIFHFGQTAEALWDQQLGRLIRNLKKNPEKFRSLVKYVAEKSGLNVREVKTRLSRIGYIAGAYYFPFFGITPYAPRPKDWGTLEEKYLEITGRKEPVWGYRGRQRKVPQITEIVTLRDGYRAILVLNPSEGSIKVVWGIPPEGYSEPYSLDILSCTADRCVGREVKLEGVPPRDVIAAVLYTDKEPPAKMCYGLVAVTYRTRSR